jgi:ribonuclease D
MKIHLHQGDLPATIHFNEILAIDSETMGLNPLRDRLCLLQMYDGVGDVHLVQFTQGDYAAPNLKKQLHRPDLLKLFHFARFDIAVIQHFLQVDCTPVYCTKIASRLVRTFTDKHGLKDLCKDITGVDLSKQQQSSDWGAATLTAAQQEYAASDVLYLHKIKTALDERLAREGRTAVAQSCFDFLPARARLDLLGWAEVDIFAH